MGLACGELEDSFYTVVGAMAAGREGGREFAPSRAAPPGAAAAALGAGRGGDPSARRPPSLRGRSRECAARGGSPAAGGGARPRRQSCRCRAGQRRRTEGACNLGQSRVISSHLSAEKRRCRREPPRRGAASLSRAKHVPHRRPLLRVDVRSEGRQAAAAAVAAAAAFWPGQRWGEYSLPAATASCAVRAATRTDLFRRRPLRLSGARLFRRRRLLVRSRSGRVGRRRPCAARQQRDAKRVGRVGQRELEPLDGAGEYEVHVVEGGRVEDESEVAQCLSALRLGAVVAPSSKQPIQMRGEGGAVHSLFFAVSPPPESSFRRVVTL